MPPVEVDFRRRLNLLDLARPRRVLAFQVALALLATAMLFIVYAALRMGDERLGLGPAAVSSLAAALDVALAPDMEIWARTCWGAAVMLFFGVGIAAAGNAFRIVGRILEGHARQYLASGALLAGGLGLLVWGGVEWRVHWGPEMLDDLLDAFFEHRGLEGVLVMGGLMHGMAGAIGLFAFTACSSCLFGVPAGGWTPAALHQRLTWLRTQLFFGATLLTLGVLSIGLLYRWMAIYAPKVIPVDVTRIGESVTLGIGIACSIALFVFYVPPALALRSEAESLAVGDDEKSRQEWLARHGLSTSPLDLAVRLGSGLAPLLLGSQLPSFVSGLGAM